MLPLLFRPERPLKELGGRESDTGGSLIVGGVGIVVIAGQEPKEGTRQKVSGLMLKVRTRELLPV